MREYIANIRWLRGSESFIDNRYSRAHQIQFDGGVNLPASSSPHVVPVPLSDATAVDPEEMFVASLSSCHMLWFLSIAAKAGFCVDLYNDDAQGKMEKNSSGKFVMSEVILKPQVIFSGQKIPSNKEIVKMHHRAHDECFIANSVKTQVLCHPVL